MDMEVQDRQNERIKWLRQFENVSGYSGVSFPKPPSFASSGSPDKLQEVFFSSEQTESEYAPRPDSP